MVSVTLYRYGAILSNFTFAAVTSTIAGAATVTAVTTAAVADDNITYTITTTIF